MAGGFAACGFAAEPIHLRYKQVRRSRKPRVFGDVFDIGLKKPFLQAISRATFTFD
jgi:hypothetical protein